MEKTILPRYLKIQLDTDLKIILLDHKNNDVGRSNWLLECQNFLLHCSLWLTVLYNNYYSLTKLFSESAKFLDTLAKLFFPIGDFNQIW